MNRGVIIVGAGGHGKVVAATALAAGMKVECFVDTDPSKTGTTVLGLPVTSDERVLRHGVLAILAIGNNRARKDAATRFNCAWQTIVHPAAHVHRTCTIGAGTVVFAGAVIQPDTVIGSHVIINTSASVDHDNNIADFVHVAPGSHLAGTVTVDEGAFIGISAAVIPNRTIGAWATIGAGSVVIRDIDAGATVAGAPARTIERGDKS